MDLTTGESGSIPGIVTVISLLHKSPDQLRDPLTLLSMHGESSFLGNKAV
jgi:hypothetical protein